MPDDILDIFREEARDHLAQTEASLLDLESCPVDERRPLVDTAFRHAHSLKGAARAVSLPALVNAAQELENTLEQFRDVPERLSSQDVTQALQLLDAVQKAFHHWDNQGESAGDAAAQQAGPESARSPAAPELASIAELFEDDAELIELFREESHATITSLGNALEELRESDDDNLVPLVERAFQFAHTFKGAVGAVGLVPLIELISPIEAKLDEFRDQPELVEADVIELVQRDFRRLEAFHKEALAQLDAPPGPEATAPPPASPVVADSQPLVEPSSPPAAGRTRAAPDERFAVRVPARSLDRMLSLAGEVRISQRGSEHLVEQLSTVAEVLQSALSRGNRLRERIKRAETIDGAHEFEAIDALCRQLDGAVERLRRLQNDYGKTRFQEALMLDELEQDIRAARLVPLASLTDPMRRPVRDLVQSLGKSARYDPQVGDVLLDKAVMEALKDPLMHLVRNAIDHGIEPPQERVAAGKAEEGVIAIRASRRAESVLIRITDDGRGIQFDSIRRKLRAAAFLSEDEIEALSDNELARYLFQPGFTTRTEATEVSGRGVGMDVVLDAIHRLQGTIRLEESSAGGTTFLITVPVTISTVRVLTISCGGQRYGIPTTALVRTGRVAPATLHEIEGAAFLTVDGEPVRWVELSDLLNVGFRAATNGQSQRSYLLLQFDGRRIALAIDDFEDETEVLLKSLEFPLSDLDAVIGGTIRPEGSVQLVLDPAWILARSQGSRRRAQAPPAPAARVLVVDDSPTTRTIVGNVLSLSGFSVQTAEDGVVALERIQTRPVDIVVSDVEMPRMDGIELTRKIKARFGIPVVLVTSLEKEEDRLRGLEAGADAYVVKSSFEGESLSETVRQLLHIA